MAKSLKDWLPLILQYLDPWVSEKDISAGDRWALSIAGELESSNFGILCITPENISSEWIMFEAGALSKSMLDSKVIPVLFDLELSELTGPLSQFQAVKADQPGLTDLIRSINSAASNPTPENSIETLVPLTWDQFESQLGVMPPRETAGKHTRPQKEVLEELVSIVRSLSSDVRNVEQNTKREERIGRPSKISRTTTQELVALLNAAETAFSNNLALPIIAGYIRDELPFVSEILLQTHTKMLAEPLLASSHAEELKVLIDTVFHVATQESDDLELRLKRSRVSRGLPELIRIAADKQAEALLGRNAKSSDLDDDIPF